MKSLKNLVVLFCAVTAVASASLRFTPEGDTPGEWAYNGVDTFAFSQSILINRVQGGTSDTLVGKQVYLPSMTISSYMNPVSGFITGTLAGGGVVEIKDGSTLLVSGTLSGGTIGTMEATAVMYSSITTDILITYVNDTFVSNYMDKLSVGNYFNLSLSLESEDTYFDTMITNGQQGSGGFSGSLTHIIPEPATMILLGLGALLTRKF